MLTDPTQLPEEVSTVFNKQLTTTMTTADEWKWQGIMLFKRKFYMSAQQCFRNAGEKDLEIRCIAY